MFNVLRPNSVWSRVRWTQVIRTGFYPSLCPFPPLPSPTLHLLSLSSIQSFLSALSQPNGQMERRRGGGRGRGVRRGRECRQDKDTEDKSGLVIVKMLTRTQDTLLHTHTHKHLYISRGSSNGGEGVSGHDFFFVLPLSMSWLKRDTLEKKKR